MEGDALEDVKQAFTDKRKEIQARLLLIFALACMRDPAQELEDYIESAQSAAKTLKRRHLA